VALSLILLMCAGIFFGSFGKLKSVSLGFDPNNLALLSVDLGTNSHSPERGQAFINQCVARLRSVSASESVAVAAQVAIGLRRISEQILPDAQAQRPIWIGSTMVGRVCFLFVRIQFLVAR